MTADPANAAETLVSLCPVVFRSHWSPLLVEVGPATRGPAYTTTLAPDLDPRTRRRFAPFDHTHRIELHSGWLPGWGEIHGRGDAADPDRVIAIGRLGGPAFLDSEIARLHHLAALVK